MIAPDPVMDPVTSRDALALRAMVERRLAAGERYFTTNARLIADCAAAMADRFFSGATLFVLGSGARASDAQHNSVEFVHPVLPGCRALPALSLSNDVSTVTGILSQGDPADVYSHQLRALARAGDIVLAFTGVPVAPELMRALQTSRDLGLLTVVLADGGTSPGVDADRILWVDDADPLVAQELHLATYHMLWELIHIVLNHRGIAPTKEDLA
ncbi:MAG TPA: SIS domain-containing protein [Candidatus Dormibacteraeota bacterium]